MSLADDLRRALAEGAQRAPPQVGDERRSIAPPSVAPVAAAVLVAFIDRPRPAIILTRRTEALRNHAGQIAFPGGRIDPGEDAIAAALREAEEEIALPREAVEVVGLGAIYFTGTNYHVTPVIATVPDGVILTPNPAEVAAVFDIAADALFAPANRESHEGEWQGATWRYYRIVGHAETVWGATAGIVINLAAQLGLDKDPARFNRPDGSPGQWCAQA